MQAEFVREYFRLCHNEGLHTALDTSGAFCTEDALRVLDETDLVLLDVKTMDTELYPKLTGIKQDNNLAFLDKRLIRLGEHVGRYKCVEKIEILPYHTLGTYKYEKMGMRYRLDGVPALSPERAVEIRNMLSKFKPCQ